MDPADPPTTAIRPGVAAGCTAALVLAAVAAALGHLCPPGHDGTDGFSTAAALAHLQVIGREPHPSNTAAHARVRDYLVSTFQKVGLHVDTHHAVGTDFRGNEVPLVNIRALLKGQRAGPAVGLAAHYDSVAAGPGAADDGAALASFLEVARLLAAGDPLRNDIVFLLTDGEELGLLGARALARDDRLNDLGMVLNFEARGTSGPSIMFETSPGNGWLIGEFGRVAPHPIATSLSDAVYQHMPNDTDFTVFKGAGLPGLNFAFIGSPQHYHTIRDDLVHLDPGSLRHHGQQALALARHFGNLDLASMPTAANVTFFTLPGIGLVRYPLYLAIPLATTAVGLAATGVWIGRRRGRIGLGGLGGAAGLVVFAAALTAGLTYATWRLLASTAISADPEWSGAGFGLVASAASAAVVCLRSEPQADIELATAAALWVALAALACAVLVPAASYVLTWPALCSAGCVLLQVCGRDTTRAGPRIWLPTALGAIPPVLLLVPITHLILLGLGLHMAAGVCLLVWVLMCTLTPQMQLIRRAAGWWLPGVPLGSGAALLVQAAW